jgi:hypothetical protein
VTDSAKQTAIASWRSVPLAKVGQVGHHGHVPSILVDIVTHLISHMDFCDSENFQCWFKKKTLPKIAGKGFFDIKHP